VRKRRRAACSQSRIQAGPHTVGRHDELLLERVHALAERARAGQGGVQLAVDGEVELVVVTGRSDAVDAPSLLVEGQLLAAEDLEARHDRLELLVQAAATTFRHRIRGPDRVDLADEPARVRFECFELLSLRACFFPPLGWTVVRVDEIRVVLADRQHESDVLLGECVEVGGRVHVSGSNGNREQGCNEGCGNSARNARRRVHGGPAEICDFPAGEFTGLRGGRPRLAWRDQSKFNVPDRFV
jgi:hypothetical protein